MPAGAALACDLLPLLQPAPNASISPDQVELHWPPHPSGNYRLQLRISHPEGPTLQTLDINTQETYWRLPASMQLPTETASVQVQVTAQCPHSGTNELLAAPPAFFIVQHKACQIELSSLAQENETLRWAPVQGAQSYQIHIATPYELSALPGNAAQAWLPPKLHVIEQGVVHTSEANIGLIAVNKPLPQFPIVIIRPLCGTTLGMPASIALRQAKTPKMP